MNETDHIPSKKRKTVRRMGKSEAFRFRGDPPGWAVILFLEPLVDGWTREVVYRASISKCKKIADIYYYSPDGTKFRSQVQIHDYLIKHKLNKYSHEQFWFRGMPIGRECAPYEIIRHAKGKIEPPTLKEEPFVPFSTLLGEGSTIATSFGEQFTWNTQIMTDSNIMAVKIKKEESEEDCYKDPNIIALNIKKEENCYEDPETIATEAVKIKEDGDEEDCKIDFVYFIESSSSQDSATYWMNLPPEPVVGPLFSAEGYDRLLACGNTIEGFEIMSDPSRWANVKKEEVEEEVEKDQKDPRQWANVKEEDGGKEEVEKDQEEIIILIDSSSEDSCTNWLHVTPELERDDIDLKKEDKKEDPGAIAGGSLTNLIDEDNGKAGQSSSTRLHQKDADPEGAEVKMPVVNICICTRDTKEPIITCRNTKCIIKNFHLNCVNIYKCIPPNEYWFCPICRGSSSSKLHDGY